MVITSCTDLDGVNSRLDSLEKTVSDLQSSVQALQQAYADGKVIKDVKAITEGDGGWAISFSDNTSINIVNGTTPYLKVDQDGYLTVSYDEGDTFSRLQDTDGKDVYVNTSSVRVSTDDDGHYVFVQYATNDTTKVLNRVVTPISASASASISGIAENDKTHVITITMADGSVFTFNKQYVYPTSIAILTTQCVYLSKNAATEVEFRVNPQSALFNYDTASADCQIVLDRVGASRGSYVTAPTAYRLSKVEQCYDEQGVLKEGQYKATIEDAGTSEDYNDQVAFVISSTDGNGSTITISSSVFQLKYTTNVLASFSLLSKDNASSVLKDVEATVSGNNITLSSPYITNVTSLKPAFSTKSKVYVGSTLQSSGSSVQDFSQPVTYKLVSDDGEINTYTVTVNYSGLPVMEINTPDGVAITSKEDWTKNATYKILNTDGSVDCEGTLSIKGRGNSTWSYPKKPYAIKLDKKTEVLGLPKEKRFDLLANWMDRTLLRNDVAYHIANLTNSMGWNPTGKYVEVVFNGTHVGNYYFCEHIKVGENRVNITELEEDVTSGDALTGGYIMEMDVYYDEEYKFKSALKGMPYMFKDPDEVNEAQFGYMQQYVNDLETALYDETKFAAREFTQYMDLDSYIDWWFVHELTGNNEPNWPKSTYVHKDVNGKMVAGPVWDFDYGTYQYNGWSVKGSLYYGRLFNDAQFRARVKEKWNAQKSLYEAVDAYIAAQATYLQHSDKLNNAMWPISSRVNNDETKSYADAVQRIRDNYKGRIAWMDSQIQSL